LQRRHGCLPLVTGNPANNTSQLSVIGNSASITHNSVWLAILQTSPTTQSHCECITSQGGPAAAGIKTDPFQRNHWWCCLLDFKIQLHGCIVLLQACNRWPSVSCYSRLVWVQNRISSYIRITTKACRIMTKPAGS